MPGNTVATGGNARLDERSRYMQAIITGVFPATLTIAAPGAIKVGDIITLPDYDAAPANADSYGDEFTARAIRRQRQARRLKAAQAYAAEVRQRRGLLVRPLGC